VPYPDTQLINKHLQFCKPKLTQNGCNLVRLKPLTQYPLKLTVMKNLILTIALGLATVANAGISTPVNEVTHIAEYRAADPIKLSQLPKDAQKYLKENYPARAVKQINRTTSNGQTFYEVTVVVEGRSSVLKFDSKGEFIDPSMTYM
jgi:hypothetical protein